MITRIRSMLSRPATHLVAGLLLAATGFVWWSTPLKVVDGSLSGSVSNYSALGCVGCGSVIAELELDGQPIQATAGIPFILELGVKRVPTSEIFAQMSEPGSFIGRSRINLVGSRVRLHIAGAEISPSDPIQVQEGNKLRWSVRISEVGDVVGFVEVQSEVFPKSWSRAPKSDLAPDVIRFDVAPNHANFTLQQMYGTPVAFILGLLISASSVVRFYWAWIDRRKARQTEAEEREAKREAEKPKIIM
ncbi:hypothetical protein [Algicella marina]|uniref:Uncharacterized protein n=1 Tax=Algicella marina TaxID=2683284 RepID=A0A6P1T4H4_9RHOB|nr:hypothetical protein [Algicella marina]QHQ35442.1 hypothetical protein GO499_09680 [Algicella marina]